MPGAETGFTRPETLTATFSVTESEPRDVTRLLAEWRAGDETALERLMPLVYDELRARAARQLQQEQTGHTLQATALVHEAFLRLVGADIPWTDRAHFFRIAARTMRRVLVDHARGLQRMKRGAGPVRIALDPEQLEAAEPPVDVLALDEALERLAQVDERKARVVELHYFGGLNYDETATAADISPATVDRDLRLAKAWLRRELERSS
jgi:RNA polymerase sigma factor (TIGR02999 family)